MNNSLKEISEKKMCVNTRPSGRFTTSVVGLVTMKSFPPRFLNVFSRDYLFLLLTMYFQFQRNSCWNTRI